LNEIWLDVQSFLKIKIGTEADHSILLCSLLLGFGIEAYIALGMNAKGEFQ